MIFSPRCKNQDLTPAIAAALLLCSGLVVQAQTTVQSTIDASARVAARASVNASTGQLQFVVTSEDHPATATLDFVAGARTPAGSEVLLLVQPIAPLAGPEWAGSLTFAGEGEGTLRGETSNSEPVVAARWTGGGRRAGRLRFSLHAAPGTYAVPVTLAVSVR